MTSRYLDFRLALGIPLALMAALLLIDPAPLDFALANLFYEPGQGFIGRHSFWLEDILHDRAKQAVIVVGHRGSHAAAAVVAADNDSTNAKDLDGVLQHRQAVEVRMHYDIGDVAVNEHLTGRQVDDLVGRHAAVGAADPKNLGLLLLGEIGEIVRVDLFQTVGPHPVAIKQA